MNLLELLVGEARHAPESDQRDALAVLVNRRLQREQEAERARKHAEILPLCRAALDKVSRIRDIELPAAAERVSESWQVLEVAQQKLWKHQASKPAAERYPSPDQIAAHDQITAELETEVAQAREEKINAEHDQVASIQELHTTSQQLANLVREEQSLRPKESEPQRTGFSLSGVR